MVMTHSQAESKQRAAVAMLQRFGNDEDAERFEAMSPEDYARHKGAEIISNPERRYKSMAKRKAAPTRAELEDRIDGLEQEVEALEGELEETQEERDALAEQVQQVTEIVAPEDEEDEEEEDDDAGEE